MINGLIEKEANKPNNTYVILRVQESNICNSKAMGIVETMPFNYGIFFSLLLKDRLTVLFNGNISSNSDRHFF